MIQDENDSSKRNISVFGKNNKKIIRKIYPIFALVGVFLVILVVVLRDKPGITLAAQMQSTFDNSQNIKLLSASVPMADINAKGGPSEYYLVDHDANVLIVQNGPSGTLVNNYSNEFKHGEISTYIVKKGDTLSEIAEKFNVSTNTIRWQNGLSHTDTIQVGQTLAILPVDGIRHTIKKGDTLGSIAKKYKGDIDEIVAFNNLSGVLIVGDEIIIPGGEPNTVSTKKPTRESKKKKFASNSNISSGYYINPLGRKGAGRKSQGYHGRWRAIDIATPVGTPLYASAPGRVVVLNNSGWGGGYGHYIILEHPNGSKTLYGHTSKNIVRLGQYVERGEMIAYSGNTGRSTGPHLHFEIRNGIDVPCVAFGYSACY